jgi:pyridoxal phosphate phosphatase PHOSPHO2
MNEFNKIAFFDFDYTIINANSNNYLNKLVIENESLLVDQNGRKLTPSIAQLNQFKYSDDLENLSNELNNTVRMNAVFNYMHSKHTICRKTMIKCLSEIKISESMINLFEILNKQQYELVIVSDSNKFLIKTILKANKLDKLFHEDKIIANEAFFDQNGCLIVLPYSEIFYKDKNKFFDCSTSYCRQNICKGSIIETFLNRKKEIKSVIYVGDGRIDYCPGLKLKKSDSFFVKHNSSLFKLIENDINLKEKIVSNIKYWKNANEIINQLI